MATSWLQVANLVLIRTHELGAVLCHLVCYALAFAGHLSTSGMVQGECYSAHSGWMAAEKGMHETMTSCSELC